MAASSSYPVDIPEPYVEFSPLHAPYWQLVLLTQLRDRVTEYEHMTSSLKDLCNSFGLRSSYLYNHVYRQKIVDSAQDLIDDWFHRHPALYDFYVWDQIKGLRKMLDAGILSLQMRIVLGRSSRTVMMLQSFYLGNRSTIDNRPTIDGDITTLVSEYRETFKHSNVSGSVITMTEPQMELYNHVPAIVERYVDNPASVQHGLEVLTTLCLVGYESYFKRVFDKIGQDIDLDEIYEYNQQAMDDENMDFFSELCHYRRLNFIRIMLTYHYDNHRINSREIMTMIINALIQTNDDDFATRVLILGNELKLINLQRLRHALVDASRGNMPKTVSLILDLISEEK